LWIFPYTPGSISVGDYLNNWLVAVQADVVTYTSQTYVETRNWAVNVPVPPLKVCSIQFWLTQLDVSYLWQAILQAVGAFDLTSMGVYYGTDWSVTDISKPQDLFFYQWGRYTSPSQAEIIITVDEIDSASYQGLQVPEMANSAN